VLQKQKNIALFILSGFLLLGWFAASYFPGRYSWGFDYLMYYSPAFRLAWLLAGTAGISFIYLFPQARLAKAVSPRPRLSLLVLITAGLVLYIWLRVKIPLLGDGILRSQEISFGRLFSFTEPLTTLVHGLLYRLLTVLGLRIKQAELAYRLASIAAGTAALLSYYFTARDRSGKGTFWPAVIILAGAGFNQIFYGYVESYGLFLAAVGWYLYAGWRSVLEPRASLLPAALAGLAVALHGSGIFLLPSLFFYWHQRSYFGTPAGRKRLLLEALFFSAIPITVLGVGLMLATRPELSTAWAELPKRSMLPLWAGPWGYGIFSPGHWLDLLNQLLLAAPACLLLLWDGPRAGVFKAPAARFLGLAAAGGILFAVIVDPKLGTARDWDLLAWPFMALLVFLVQGALSSGPGRKRWALVAMVSAWLFLPWVAINASAERSLARYADLLSGDNRSAAYGYENLAIYYRDHRDPEKTEWAYRMARDHDSLNPRHIYNYALALSQNGQDLRSLPYFQRSLQLEARSAKRWNDYGAALIKCQRPQAARSALGRALALDPDYGNALYNMGVAGCLMSDWPRADSFFALTGRTGFSDPWLYFYWGEVKLKLKQYRSAEGYLKMAIDSGIQDSLLDSEYRQARAALAGGQK
jgi:Tfp pilus assembly protein PilF